MDISHFGWRAAFLGVVLLTCVGCDQAIKQYAVENLQETRDNPRRYLADTFRIQYAENHGAFLSLGADWKPEIRFLAFTVLNGIILPTVAGIVLFWREIDRWSLVALALILAGGVGNLIDRVTTDDAVVIDFLNLGVGWLRTGVFNVADMAIMAGFFLLLPHLFRPKAKPAVAAEG